MNRRALCNGRRPSERLRTKVNWAGRMAEGGGAADAAESMPAAPSCPPGHCEPLAQLCCVRIVGACAEGKRRTAVGSMRPVCGGARAARPRGRSAAARAGPARMHRAQFAGGVRRDAQWSPAAGSQTPSLVVHAAWGFINWREEQIHFTFVLDITDPSRPDRGWCG